MGIKDRNILRSSTFFCPFQYYSSKQSDHFPVFSCIIDISSDNFLLLGGKKKKKCLSRTPNLYYMLSVVHLCGKKGHGLAEIQADPVIFFFYFFFVLQSI